MRCKLTSTQHPTASCIETSLERERLNRRMKYKIMAFAVESVNQVVLARLRLLIAIEDNSGNVLEHCRKRRTMGIIRPIKIKSS